MTTPPPPKTLTPVEVSVLRPYALGAVQAAIAKVAGLDADRVNSIIVTRASMSRQHAAELVRQHDATINRLRHRDDVEPPEAPQVPAPSTEVHVAPSTLDAILAAGEAHPLPRIRAYAVKARALIETIEAAVLQADQERKAEEAASRARKEASARIKDLERQLAEARAAAGGSKAIYARASDAQRARRWAAENGLPCSPNGRIPVAVLAGYRAALAAAAPDG